MHDKLAYLWCDVCYAWKDGLTKRWLSWKPRLFEAVAAKITRIQNRTRQAKLAKIIRVALGGEKCQPVVTFCSTGAYQVYPGVVGREDLAIKSGIYIGRCQLSLLLFVCFFFFACLFSALNMLCSRTSLQLSSVTSCPMSTYPIILLSFLCFLLFFSTTASLIGALRAVTGPTVFTARSFTNPLAPF